MRKIIVSQFLTLDGVAQAPGGPDEDSEGGFAFGGWQMPYFEDAGEEAGEIMGPIFGNMGAILLGRKTYDIFSSFWPHQDQESDPAAKLINSVPIYVASHQDHIAEWKNGHVTQLGDNLTKELGDIKQQDGKDIVVWGSTDFVQTLIRENLIDEFYLIVHPLILGTGKKLFHDGLPKRELNLLSSKTTKNGVQVLSYAVKNPDAL
jgi:dihydrofolate reductase